MNVACHTFSSDALLFLHRIIAERFSGSVVTLKSQQRHRGRAGAGMSESVVSLVRGSCAPNIYSK
jgi:hypothetical protein